MKKMLNTIAAVSALVALSVPFAANASDSQYVPGLEGIKGSVVPPAGVYHRVYLANYSSDENETLPPGSNVDVGALVNRVLWVTPQKIMGGDLLFDANIPIVSTDIEVKGQVQDDRTGLANIYAGSYLAWHGDRWDTIAGAGWYFGNSGDFDLRRVASPAREYDSLSFTLGGNVKLNKAADIDFSALGTYEIPQEDGLDEELMIEWGLSKSFGLLDVGLVGYNTFETGAGDEKRNAVGVSTAYFSPDLLLGGDIGVYKEYSNENTFEGNLIRGSLTKAF